jgi:hypothetical protein
MPRIACSGGNMLPTQTGPLPQQESTEVLADPLRQFIAGLLVRRQPPERIVAAVEANFGVEIDCAQVLACAKAQSGLPTLTGRLRDPNPGVAAANSSCSSTLTGRLQDQYPSLASASPESPRTFTGRLQDRKGVPAGASSQDWRPTLTGRLQDEESMPNLSDEIKEFIVRNLARYDTPSQVAAAVKVNFNIELCRQQVYRYDPDCSQPPAQRWRDLHAATRRKFLSEIAEIGIAHKAVRLRMLDRWAREAEAHNFSTVAAAFLQQAAKECGGAYERRKSPLSQLGVQGLADLVAPAAAPSIPGPGENLDAAARAVSESGELALVHGPAGQPARQGLRA